MAVMAAIVGFTHLLTGFDNPALIRAVTTLLELPLHQPPSHLRPAPAHNAKASSNDCRAHQPLPTHRPWAAASRCCSPRPTGVSSPPAWPSSTQGSQQIWPTEAHWRTPGANSTDT